MQMEMERLVEHWAKVDPAREAIFDGTERVSYGALCARIDRLSAALARMNVCRGDRILVFIPNWHEFIVIFFAAAKRGAILVPCNQIVKEEELRGYMDALAPKLIFINERMRGVCAEALSGQVNVVAVRFSSRAYLSLADLYAMGGEAVPSEAAAADDVFVIVHTSGSTGRPKGAELTRANLLLSARNIGYGLNCARGDVFFVPLPCCHLFGMVTGMLTPLIFGGKIVLQAKFDAEAALCLFSAEGVTVACGVPTMFVRELEAGRARTGAPISIRTGVMAGARCDEELRRRVRAAWNCDVMVAYGSTESVSVSMTRPGDSLEQKLATVGRAFEGVSVRVAGPDGAAVEAGEPGELIVKGYGVMKGYHGLAEETAAVLSPEGWLRTGDMAVLDADGYIKIIGRVKEMILRGGYNVYPEEVELAYLAHPQVGEICVVGLPDAALGERICACIRLAAGAAETASSLRLYAQNTVAKYKVPDRVVLMEELPKLPNGKFNKALLKRICMDYRENTRKRVNVENGADL